MTYKLTEGKLDAPAHPDVVEGLFSRLGVSLPGDYLEFLRQHNGGEGFVGDNYIIFWRAEELADFNREYEVDKYAPGILLFGSDGGGERLDAARSRRNSAEPPESGCGTNRTSRSGLLMSVPWSRPEVAGVLSNRRE